MWGDYHTHGDYSIDVPFGPIATGDPKRDDFNSDQFSSAGPRNDLDGIRAVANRNEVNHPYFGFLGTPSGNFKSFDPASGLVNSFSGIDCRKDAPAQNDPFTQGLSP